MLSFFRLICFTFNYFCFLSFSWFVSFLNTLDFFLSVDVFLCQLLLLSFLSVTVFLFSWCVSSLITKCHWVSPKSGGVHKRERERVEIHSLFRESLLYLCFPWPLLQTNKQSLNSIIYSFLHKMFRLSHASFNWAYSVIPV